VLMGVGKVGSGAVTVDEVAGAVAVVGGVAAIVTVAVVLVVGPLGEATVGGAVVLPMEFGTGTLGSAGTELPLTPSSRGGTTPATTDDRGLLLPDADWSEPGTLTASTGTDVMGLSELGSAIAPSTSVTALLGSETTLSSGPVRLLGRLTKGVGTDVMGLSELGTAIAPSTSVTALLGSETTLSSGPVRLLGRLTEGTGSEVMGSSGLGPGSASTPATSPMTPLGSVMILSSGPVSLLGRVTEGTGSDVMALSELGPSIAPSTSVTALLETGLSLSRGPVAAFETPAAPLGAWVGRPGMLLNPGAPALAVEPSGAAVGGVSVPAVCPLSGAICWVSGPDTECNDPVAIAAEPRATAARSEAPDLTGESED
jgi:hypothetical protein